MNKPDIVEINVQSKDDGEGGDGKYCAIVMGWHGASEFWYSTGIVIRDTSPILALAGAVDRATEKGWWK